MTSLYWVLEEKIPVIEEAAGVMKLMGAIAYELEYVERSKSCEKCTDLRILAGVKQIFPWYDQGSSLQDFSAACAIVRDHKQNLCPECEEREKKRKAEQR